MRRLALAMAVAAAPAGAAADGVITYVSSYAFEDAAFGVESAILDRGLVIDFVSHVGEMLNRTGEDVGSETELFVEADIFLFCSAVVSRSVMEADWRNIGHCPYGIFVAELASGEVHVGYRDLPDGSMAEVEALLDEIAKEAAGVE